MKKFYLFLGLAVGLAALLVVAHFLKAAHNQTVIAKVFSEQAKAAQTLQGVNSLADKKKALMAYSQDVRSIDASTCPKDFQAAWFDFVTAVTTETEKNVSGTELKSLPELSAWLKAHHLTLDAMRNGALGASDNIIPSFQRCRHIAVSYGLSFKPRP
jgi:hypothetical protein